MGSSEFEKKISALGIRPTQTPQGRVIGEVNLQKSQLRDPVNNLTVASIKVEWVHQKLRIIHPPGLRFVPPIPLDKVTSQQSLEGALNGAYRLFERNLRECRAKLDTLGLSVQISGSGEYIAPVELFERGTALLRIEADGIWIRRFIPQHRKPLAMAHKLNLDALDDAADLGIAVDSALRRADAAIEESVPMRRAPSGNASITLGELAAAFDPRAKIVGLKIQSIYPQGARVFGLTVDIDDEKGVRGSVYEQGRLVSAAKYDKKKDFSEWVKDLLPQGSTPPQTQRPTSAVGSSIAPGTQWFFGVKPQDPRAATVHYTFVEQSGRPCGASLSLPNETFMSLFGQRPGGFTGHVRVTGERETEVLYVHLNSQGRMMTNPISIDRGTFVLCFKRAL